MVAHKKLNLKEKITDDYLDLSLCNLEKIPIKEIVILLNKKKERFFIFYPSLNFQR